jgi:ketosteroid isomerase-like protein
MIIRMSESDLQTQIDEFQRCIEERDAEGANAVLADDYALVLVHPTPAVMPRDRWLEVLPDYVVRAYELEERRIDVGEDCACVLQRVAMQASVLGEDRSGTFVITDVWRRRSSGWQIWRRHSTPLAAGRMPGA